MIDILMATYNGETYITEQIESILAQTCQDWRLIIQDDGSSDHTVSIVNGYQQKYPEKIQLLIRKTPSGSAKGNFLSLFPVASSDYIMTCDQDDVWEPDKIENTFQAMVQAETRWGKDVPILVHTDLTVVDSHLGVIAKSMFKYQGLDKRACSLNRLIVQNNVTGCTMMINRALCDYLLCIQNTDALLMHDWWCALIASAMGQVVYLDQPTVLYRQHGDNQLGAVNNRSIPSIVKRYFQNKDSRVRPASIQKRMTSAHRQAEYFLESYRAILSIEAVKCLQRYIQLPTYPKYKRVYYILKYHYTRQNLPMLLAQLILH